MNIIPIKTTKEELEMLLGEVSGVGIQMPEAFKVAMEFMRIQDDFITLLRQSEIFQVLLTQNVMMSAAVPDAAITSMFIKGVLVGMMMKAPELVGGVERGEQK